MGHHSNCTLWLLVRMATVADPCCSALYWMCSVLEQSLLFFVGVSLGVQQGPRDGCGKLSTHAYIA